ncbi:MAG: class I tRNA ligase family protein, partial [Planctomycetes bacterium]|nr:class I tRNA ligase family protein [Planctomycetota bacterium]
MPTKHGSPCGSGSEMQLTKRRCLNMSLRYRTGSLVACLVLIGVPCTFGIDPKPTEAKLQGLSIPTTPAATATIEQILDRAIQNIARRYNLNEIQTRATEDLMKIEVNKFLLEHEDEVWPVIRDLLSAQALGGPPTDMESAKRIGKAAGPLARLAQEAIFRANDEWRKILTDEQKVLHDYDLDEMTKNFEGIHSRMQAWAEGKPTDTSLLVWTTTPWTLLGNCAATVGSDIDYALVKVPTDDGHEHVILAKAVVERHFGDDAEIVDDFLGDALLGVEYQPLFNYGTPTVMEGTGDSDKHWVVIPGDFVDIETGTGIVHTAPAFGEDDYRVCKESGVGFLCYVKPDGTFDKRVTDVDPYQETPFAGQFCKDADKGIIRWLKDRGYLLRQDTYRHPYPFCPRAEDDPLIQYARRGWFIKTSDFVQDFLANNAKIAWQPEHIRDGRFGNFLANNVDWAISRERFWGTPLPVWVCEKTGHMECMASYDELLAKPEVQGTEVWEQAKAETPELSDHLKVHKPYIDAVTYQSPKDPSARMRRVPEVIDVWFDAGSMPFAQWGYPHKEGSKQRFKESFPADFISEAIDQTRGWFYSQLAISTLLFGEGASGTGEKRPYPHPYRNCIVLGLMLGEDGQKMSKSKRNYREPNEIFDRYGADALRWYFFANQPPWTSIRYSERAIKESIPEFLLRLWNVYSFFVIYANLDGFDPVAGRTGEVGELTSGDLAGGQGYRPVSERRELDRWILDDLYRTTQIVIERMDAYDNYGACGRITEFVDALSNWFVRRSRDRFWIPDKSDPDKWDAYWTLYECLLTVTKRVAPGVPFLAEKMWRNLAVSLFGDQVPESVHLCDYPEVEASLINDRLAAEGTIVREISSLGRAA